MLLKKPLQNTLARQLSRRPLGLRLVVLVMHQPFAYQSDFQIRVVHLPDLPSLKWWEDISTLSCFALHDISAFQLLRVEHFAGFQFGIKPNEEGSIFGDATQKVWLNSERSIPPRGQQDNEIE
jgi:hypothetical protein